MTQRDYDVIVIGSGAAGLSAAVAARDAGARVLVCEAADRLGGSSSASGGLIYAAGTALQRAQGVEDSPQDLFDHYMLINRWEVEPAVARRYADEGASAIEWLMSLGVEFLPKVFAVGHSPVPRGHRPKENGFGIIQALSAAISRGNVEVALNTRAEKLLTDESGAVTGIRADGVDVTSHAVVVASGGLGNASLEIKREYYPDSQQCGEDWHFYIGVETNRGDAIKLAHDAGAEITGHNSGLMINAASYHKNVEGEVPGWAVFVNKKGRRFINEQIDYAVASHNINRQPDKMLYVILDDDAFRQSPDDPRFRFTATFAEAGAPSYSPDWLAKGVETGAIFKADTLEELADKAGIEKSTFLATIAEYNEDVRKGLDSHYLKNPATMVTVEKAPFYAMPRRPAQVSVSSVGLRINADARVYAENGTYVPGLFAAGEASGGVWNHYVASGCSIGNCVVFGRLAGQNAAACRQGETPRSDRVEAMASTPDP